MEDAPIARAAARPRAPSAPASDGRVFSALRQWRLERARADGKPSYVIAHDALLAAIVDERPVSPAALRRVKGMGPAKLDRYGEEILAILARS